VAAVLLLAGTQVLASPKDEELPDTIVQKGDKKIKCEVVKEGSKELSYKDGLGKPHTMAWDSIVRVDYKDIPVDLTAAEMAIERRDYFKGASAAQDAIGACGDGRLKELFLARAKVAKAKALRGQSDYKGAADMASQALDAAGEGRWAKGAHYEKVAALSAAQDEGCAAAGDAAEKYADSIKDVEYKAEISLLEGDFYLAKKDRSKASEKYSAVKDSKRQDMQDRATLGLARVKLVCDKDFNGAEEGFRSLAKTTTDPDALAGAQLGLGDVALGKAQRANPVSPDELRSCLELYLRGAVLAQPVGGGSSDNHEKTLKGAAEVCVLIANTVTVPAKTDPKYEKAASGKRYFIDYARKLYEELVRTYPSAQDSETYRNKINDLRAKSVALAPATQPEANK
jgi:hypothetical protein